MTLIVYDILGREVAILVNEKQKPGNYEVEFEGSELTSGVYFYQLSAGEFTDTKKVILYEIIKLKGSAKLPFYLSHILYHKSTSSQTLTCPSPG